jgi:hypothetical protein
MKSLIYALEFWIVLFFLGVVTYFIATYATSARVVEASGAVDALEKYINDPELFLRDSQTVLTRSFDAANNALKMIMTEGGVVVLT